MHTAQIRHRIIRCGLHGEQLGSTSGRSRDRHGHSSAVGGVDLDSCIPRKFDTVSSDVGCMASDWGLRVSKTGAVTGTRVPSVDLTLTHAYSANSTPYHQMWAAWRATGEYVWSKQGPSRALKCRRWS